MRWGKKKLVIAPVPSAPPVQRSTARVRIIVDASRGVHVIEVNVSELGLVTTSGKVVWGKYAQVTNNPELDGCINAVLLV